MIIVVPPWSLPKEQDIGQQATRDVAYHMAIRMALSIVAASLRDAVCIPDKLRRRRRRRAAPLGRRARETGNAGCNVWQIHPAAVRTRLHIVLLLPVGKVL
jgi:hypothetical protein